MIFFQPSFIIWNCWRTAMTIFVICFEKTPHYPSVPHTRHFSTLLPHKGHSFSAPKISHNHTSNLFGSDGFLWKWRISGAEKERLLCWSDVHVRVEVPRRSDGWVEVRGTCCKMFFRKSLKVKGIHESFSAAWELNYSVIIEFFKEKGGNSDRLGFLYLWNPKTRRSTVYLWSSSQWKKSSKLQKKRKNYLQRSSCSVRKRNCSKIGIRWQWNDRKLRPWRSGMIWF